MTGGVLGPLGALAIELGAVIGALVMVLGTVWRVARPGVRAFVAEQTAAARQLTPETGASALDRLTLLVDGQTELREQLAVHDAQLAEVEDRLAEHLLHAATELSMLRAVCAAAGVQLLPRPETAPRRRWYDPDDPAVTSWEVRRVPPRPGGERV